MFCFHKFVDGFGGMGDAVKCVKCGESTYPGVFSFSWLYPLIHNDETYGSRRTFPFIIKFPTEITSRTDWNSWTHFFDRYGKLKPKSEFTEEKL